MAKIKAPYIHPDDERKKLRNIASLRELGGLANDTKWKELIESCCAFDWRGPRFRCKCIDSDFVSKWDGEWHAIPYPFMAIEWIDIDCIEITTNRGLLKPIQIDRANEIEDILLRIGLEFERGVHTFRVFGYAPFNLEGFDAR